jgi:putative cell wall-binding protein
MQKTNLFKVLSLLSFIILVSIFIFYRGGYFNSFLNGNLSKKQNHVIQLEQDSIKKVETRLSSSKSFVLTDNVIFDIDSTKKTTDTLRLTKEELKLMVGSKSAIIFKPIVVLPDSVKQKK